MPITATAARRPQPTPGRFPVGAIDRARDLLGGARMTVRGMQKSGDLGFVMGARRDVLAAVRLLSRATSIDVPFSRQMSLATSHALDAALALDKVLKSLQFIDSGLGQTFAYRALDTASRSLDRAWSKAMTGTHP